MRKLVREHNVYRWAGRLIEELCDVRLDIDLNGTGSSTGMNAGSGTGSARAPSSETGVNDVTARQRG
jgi:hypothetical protein